MLNMCWSTINNISTELVTSDSIPLSSTYIYTVTNLQPRHALIPQLCDLVELNHQKCNPLSSGNIILPRTPFPNHIAFNWYQEVYILAPTGERKIPCQHFDHDFWQQHYVMLYIFPSIYWNRAITTKLLTMTKSHTENLHHNILRTSFIWDPSTINQEGTADNNSQVVYTSV